MTTTICLKQKTIQELQDIILRDYKISLSEAEANEFGVSLLRLSKLANTILVRAHENKNIDTIMNNHIKQF